MENGQHPAATGIAPIEAMPAPAVERYGRYFLIERIGRGGMAEVFRAVAQGVEGFRRVFVIKRLRPEKLDSPDLVRMFCDEARLSALLHHPNVVQVYDFGQISGTHFLAMEYLRGKDLAAVMKASRIARAAMNPPLAAYIAQQVAIGLHYAHTLSRMDGRALGIVHRDVTPSNIMLQRTGAVKILDFGIAQATNFARQTETGGGRVKGKLAYLSPEQVRLEPLDGRSDVFALGVVLWEMLVGQRLFSADSEFLTMRNVLTQPIPAPSSLRPQVSRSLDAVVARALQRDRARRYADAREMADDLEKVLREAPCHSQALEHLLQHLFGDESVEVTPELPDLTSAAESHVHVRWSPTVPFDTPLSGSHEAVSPLPRDDGTGSPHVVAAPTPFYLPAPSLPDRRPLVRGSVAVLSALTLIGCFAWASWRSWHAPFAAAAAASEPTPALVVAPVLAEAPAPEAPVPGAPQPESSPVEPPRLPALPSSREARADAVRPLPPARTRSRPKKARLAKVVRTHVAKKRPARRLPNDVTFDPFK
jgi:eukaryotic-like serine/threonine-protein kinase